MKYREYIVRYYASHDDIPVGHQDGEIVAELVRCEECKHYKKDVKCVGGHYDGCGVWLDEGCETPVDEEGYCSYAERRKK